jgi:hypothetical protein
VQILLNAGADVNMQRGAFGKALQAASFGGHKELVQIVLNAGADINMPGGESGILSRQHNMKVTRNWCKFSSMQVEMSTCREECMVMLSRQLHCLQVTMNWYTFSSMQVQMSTCRRKCLTI